MANSHPSTADKRRTFRELHENGCFVIPNPWDVGTACYLQGLGFKAVGTTSAGAGWSRARADGKLSLDDVLEHLQDIVGKKGFPVGKEIMQNSAEGRVNEVTYFWPRPGAEKALEKHTFYTKVIGQNCGVGYYKD